MTLCINHIRSNVLIHVSDRLVSQKRGRKYEKFESAFNKLVCCYFLDGYFFISFTGDAYIGSVPVDTFIANSMIDISDGEFEDDYPAVIQNSGCKKKVGKSIKELCQKIFNAIGRGGIAAVHIEISFVGFQLKGRLMLPMTYLLYSPVGCDYIKINKKSSLKRYEIVKPGRSELFCIPRGLLSHNDRQGILKNTSNLDDQSINRFLIGEIRRVSVGSDVVGPDVMSATIDFRGQPRAYFCYYPYDATDVKVYSPWVISRNSAFPPLAMEGQGGQFVYAWGGLPMTLQIKASQNPLVDNNASFGPENILSMGGHIRKKWP